nr:hypothetical protein [Tanacetum cinerariifolium]
MYVSGRVDIFDMVDINLFTVVALNMMVLKLGYTCKSELIFYNYLRPLTSLDEGLYALACEEDVRCLATLVRSFKLIEVYIEHGVTALDSYLRASRSRTTLEEINDELAGSIAANGTEKMLLLTCHESSEIPKELVCDSVTPSSLPQADCILTPPTDESVITYTQLSGVHGVDTQSHVIDDVIRQLSFDETELDGEACFADVTRSGVDIETQSELPVSEELDVGRTQDPILAEVSIQEPIMAEVSTQEPIVAEVSTQEPIVSEVSTEVPIVEEVGTQDVSVEDVVIEDYVSSGKMMHSIMSSEDAGTDDDDDDDDVDEDFFVDKENEIVEPNNERTWMSSIQMVSTVTMKFSTPKEADRVYLHSIESKRNLKVYKNDGVRIRARCDRKVLVFTRSHGDGLTGPNHGMKPRPSGSSGPTSRSKKRKNTCINADSQASTSCLDAHDKGDLYPWVLAKSDLLLNNIYEVFNGKIVRGRDKPVITLLEYIREYCMKRIVNVQGVINKCIGPLTPTATRIMESTKKEAHLMKVQWNGANKYQVSGRPRKKRKRSKHEDETFVKDGKLSRKRRTITCQSCGNTGHNKETCKGQGRKATTGGNNAEASCSAFRQAQQTEPAAGQGGSGAGAVIGLSTATGEGGQGVFGAKSDLLLNNIYEVFNGKIVRGRDKPVITLLEYIREYCMKRIVNVQGVINKCIGPLTPTATRIMESTKKEAHLMKVQWNGANKYQVSGRPRKKRKRSKHEDETFVKDGKLSRKRRTITCQSCGNTGHNKETCKGQGRKATTGGNNAEASCSAFRQAQQTEPAAGQDGSGGSGAGTVIGLSTAADEGGQGGASQETDVMKDKVRQEEEDVPLDNNIEKQIGDFVDMPSEAVEQRMDANVPDEIDGAKGEQVLNHVVKKGNLVFLVCKEIANPDVNELVNKEKSSDATIPVLPTEEPEYSLSMGYEHLSTISKTESDEVIESSAKNLVPIPNEYEVTSEDESECDLPVCEDHSEILSDSNNDDISSDDDAFEDIEYVEASLPDSEFVSLEEENDVYQEEEEFDLEDILQIRDVVLHEKLLSINRHIANIESSNNNPTPDRVLNSSASFPIFEESDNSLSISDNSLPEFETFSDHTEETRIGKLLIDDSIIFPENESSNFNHQDDPSFPRPPPKPPDVEFFFDFKPNSGEVISAVMNNIDELNEDECFDPGGEIYVFANVEDNDYFPFIFVIRIFLPYLIYLEVFPLLLSARSEDTIFDPGKD